uniref:Transmembrane protein n=1 Tax=Leptospirillum ferriphilum TaxID=178606 RepID=A0A7C3QWV3_9BACT
MNKIIQKRSAFKGPSLPVFFLLLSDVFVAVHGVRTETPLLNFPFLALVHTLAILVIVPPALLIGLTETVIGRMGAAMVIVGGIVLVLGFSFVPRSLVPTEAGLMILAGCWFLMKTPLAKTFSGRFCSERFIFWGLMLTVLTGIILGLTLARPWIDPIPFRGILLHAFLGIAFTLTALSAFPLKPSGDNPTTKGNTLTAFLYLSGMTVICMLPLGSDSKRWIVLSLAFLLSGITFRTFFSEKKAAIPLALVAGAIFALSGSFWQTTPGPSMVFFLLTWVYVLTGQAFGPGKIAILSGSAGSVLILSGLWEASLMLISIGLITHLGTYVSVLGARAWVAKDALNRG